MGNCLPIVRTIIYSQYVQYLSFPTKCLYMLFVCVLMQVDATNVFCDTSGPRPEALTRPCTRYTCRPGGEFSWFAEPWELVRASSVDCTNDQPSSNKFPVLANV